MSYTKKKIETQYSFLHRILNSAAPVNDNCNELMQDSRSIYSVPGGGPRLVVVAFLKRYVSNRSFALSLLMFRQKLYVNPKQLTNVYTKSLAGFFVGNKHLHLIHQFGIFIYNLKVLQ
jgi:hypothetical protein